MGGLIKKEDIKEDQEEVGEAKVWQCLSHTVCSTEVKCATPEESKKSIDVLM